MSNDETKKTEWDKLKPLRAPADEQAQWEQRTFDTLGAVQSLTECEPGSIRIQRMADGTVAIHWRFDGEHYALFLHNDGTYNTHEAC